MAAWPKSPGGGVFSKNFRPGGGYTKNTPPTPPIPVACYKLILLVIPTTQQIPSLAEEVLSRKISKFDKFITIIYSGV